MTIHQRTLRRNIRAVLAQATPDEISDGREWYAEANRFCAALAAAYDSETRIAAGVTAAISPQLGWDLNRRYAEMLFRVGDAPTTGRSKARALLILGGVDPDAVLAPPKGQPRSGQKVRAFYACLVDPQRARAVVVDRHAYDVAQAVVGDDTSRKALERVGVYDEIARAYTAVARQHGLAAHQVQAITWLTWRRLKAQLVTTS